MEEVLQVGTQFLDVFLICRLLLDIQWNDPEVIEILQPREVVFTLDQLESPELAQVAEGKVVLVQVKIPPMSFFTRENHIGFLKNSFKLLSEERLLW